MMYRASPAGTQIFLAIFSFCWFVRGTCGVLGGQKTRTLSSPFVVNVFFTVGDDLALCVNNSVVVDGWLQRDDQVLDISIFKRMEGTWVGDVKSKADQILPRLESTCRFDMKTAPVQIFYLQKKLRSMVFFLLGLIFTLFRPDL